MSDTVQLALITAGTAVAMGLMTITTQVITHLLDQKKLSRIEQLANGALTALTKRAEKQDDTIAGQLPAETNPKKVLEPKPTSHE